MPNTLFASDTTHKARRPHSLPNPARLTAIKQSMLLVSVPAAKLAVAMPSFVAVVLLKTGKPVDE